MTETTDIANAGYFNEPKPLPQSGLTPLPNMAPTDAIAAALAKAQGAMENATLNKVNPHFKSKYADLAAIRDAVIPALSANGIAVAQTTHLRDGQFVLVTRLLHSSGQHIESEYPLPNEPGKPQVMGSALTYARRYGLSTIGCISAEEDDDGNAGQQGNGGKADTANAQPISNADAKLITEFLKKHGGDEVKFRQLFGVESIEALPQSRQEEAWTRLREFEAKQAKAAKETS